MLNKSLTKRYCLIRKCRYTQPPVILTQEDVDTCRVGKGLSFKLIQGFTQTHPTIIDSTVTIFVNLNRTSN